jgi:hypothetical protein
LSEKTSKLYQLEKQLGDKVSDCNQPAVQDFNMKISMDGTWYYQGTPINRVALVKLFASVLSKDRNGIYWLVTPVERGTIEVEDAPFLAVEVNLERIPPNEDITQLHPWKIWQVTNDPLGSSAPAVRFTQPDDNANTLLGVYDKFSKLADDQSGIPSASWSVSNPLIRESPSASISHSLPPL